MKTKVLIIGGGIAGLTLSCLLGAAQVPNIVVEPHQIDTPPPPALNGRTAALMGASTHILQAAGVWDRLQPKTAPLETMRIIDDSDPNQPAVQIDFAANDIGEANFGRNIPNHMLHLALLEQIKSYPTSTLLSGSKLQELQTTPTLLNATLDNNKTIQADLCVGADGRNSKVRELVQIKVKQTDYDQQAITCLISHSKPHNNTSTEHHRSGGPFTMVPMPDDAKGTHYSSIVWVEKTEDANRFIKLDKQQFEQALQQRTRHALGQVALASSPESWPLKSLIAQNLTAPRIALIAEAAHVMSPIGAQGLNLSLRDVACLCETIIDGLRVGEDIGSAPLLKRYVQNRKADMTTRFYGVDQYNKIVSNNIGFLRDIRRTGLKSLQSIPAFKQIVMNQGLNPSMGCGRLAQGGKL